MRVYLVRHAEAEKDAPGGDAARRLTREGRARFQGLLDRLGPRLEVARVLTSPLVRARETAELLARAAEVEVEEDAELGSGASTGRQLLAVARRGGRGAALVGHNPEVADAVALAAGGPRRTSPGTIALVELGADGARLLWLEAPEG